MELKKYKNKKKIKMYILIFMIFLLISIGGYIYYRSYALYEDIKNFDMINGTVEDPGDIYFAYYIDDEISRNIPLQSTGYTLDEEKSNCTNNVTVSFDYSIWEVKLNYQNYNTTTNTRTKCTLYFYKNKTLEKLSQNENIYDIEPDFKQNACDYNCDTDEAGIFRTYDNDGISYYYRGSVKNNYVKFANFYWRILRINGNGSIRLIYDGTTAHDYHEVSADKVIANVAFNTSKDDNMYVGYMYTKGEVHGLSTSSNAKTTLDNWYQANLLNYQNFLDVNAGFCGDRSLINSKNETTGINQISTFYTGYGRSITSTPTLICENMSDYYTVSSATKGNKALTYPIGLLTLDDVMFAGYAGGVTDGTEYIQKENKTNFLTSGVHLHLMTPDFFKVPFGYGTEIGATIYVLTSRIDDSWVTNPFGVRPVVNIRSDVSITGSGTMFDPYVVN